MAEYIDKKLLIGVLKNREDCVDCTDTDCVDCMCDFIACIVPSDVAEFRHGGWLNFYGEWSTAECDQCGECYEVSPDEEPKEEYFNAFKQAYKYCPNCGAKMGDDEE